MTVILLLSRTTSTDDLKYCRILEILIYEVKKLYLNFGDVSGIDPLQCMRMQQGSQSAGFIMTELDYGASGLHLPENKNHYSGTRPAMRISLVSLNVVISTFYMPFNYSEVGRTCTNAVDCTHRSFCSKWLLSSCFIALLASRTTAKGKEVHITNHHGRAVRGPSLNQPFIKS